MRSLGTGTWAKRGDLGVRLGIGIGIGIAPARLLENPRESVCCCCCDLGDESRKFGDLEQTL